MWTDSTWQCTCLADAAQQTSSEATGRFRIRISTLPGDTGGTRLQIQSTGCKDPQGQCLTATEDAASVQATASVMAQWVPSPMRLPAAPLTCGAECGTAAHQVLQNKDLAAQGVLVHAGGPVNLQASTQLFSLPGTPGSYAIAAGDTRLAALTQADPQCRQSRLLKHYIGTDVDGFSRWPMTRAITCQNADACAEALRAGYASGYRFFHFPQGLQLNASAGSWGSPQEPLLIVSEGDIHLQGQVQFFGLIFSQNPDANAMQMGTGKVQGAVVACQAHTAMQPTTLEYDMDLLTRLQTIGRQAVALAGSWKLER